MSSVKVAFAIGLAFAALAVAAPASATTRRIVPGVEAKIDAAAKRMSTRGAWQALR